MASSRSNRRQPVAKRRQAPATPSPTDRERATSPSPITQDGDASGWIAMLTAAFVLLGAVGITLLLVASAGNA